MGHVDEVKKLAICLSSFLDVGFSSFSQIEVLLD